MSSPLVKISEQSWSLSCLCCNCAQEVRDTLRMEVGPAFVEYNHRFTCPECQTYNQILLTRVMFETAQIMVLPSMSHNQNHDFNSDNGGSPLGYSPGAPSSFNAAEEDWSSIPPHTESSPFDNSSSFSFSPPAEPEAGPRIPDGDRYRPPIPSFEAAAPTQPAPAPQPAPVMKVAPSPPLPQPKPAKSFNGQGGSIDSDDFDALNKIINKPDKKGAGNAGVPRSIKLPGGLVLPLNLQTGLAGVAGLIVLVGTFYIFTSRPAPDPPAPAKAPAKKPAATTPAKTTTPAKPVVAPVVIPTVPLVEAQMIDIPGGEYTIGRSDGGDYERPSHKVEIKPFQIDIREVTREEYAKFVTETGHKAPKSWVGGTYKGSGRLPVTDVDWNDAAAYAKWAGKRLPTEAEWEIASSGKDHLLYPWGNDWADNRANTREIATDGPQPAGTFPTGRSPFGLYDMSGNVWEWTASEPEAYPGSAQKIANSQNLRVIRGGAFNEAQKVATTSARNWVEATITSSALGFRCVKDK